jgi:uncharacterized membrane protein
MSSMVREVRGRLWLRCLRERSQREVPRSVRLAVTWFALLLAGITFAPALLGALGFEVALADQLVRAACRPFCHQLRGRTPMVGEHLLPLCARCAGLWLGICLGVAAGLSCSWRWRRAVGLGVVVMTGGLSVLEALREARTHLGWPGLRLGLGLLLGGGFSAAVARDALVVLLPAPRRSPRAATASPPDVVPPRT